MAGLDKLLFTKIDKNESSEVENKLLPLYQAFVEHNSPGGLFTESENGPITLDDLIDFD